MEENQTVTALMKRLSLSAEDKERSAAVSGIVDLVKKGGVGALKVCPPTLPCAGGPHCPTLLIACGLATGVCVLSAR